MRKLIQIPIVHTSKDLGSLLEKVKKEYVSKLGLKKWNQHLQATENLWKKIRSLVLALPVDFNDLKIFQDGLPVCDHASGEMKIVQKLAEGGSLNHQLLAELVLRGAKIVGTEDIALLLKERERLLRPAGGTLFDDLMEQRDRFIGERISNILREGETGILFMGALHKVTDYLAKDIEIQVL